MLCLIREGGRELEGATERTAPRLPERPEPRRAYRTELLDEEGLVVDEGITLYFRAPASATGR